jgi:hypothetical protein
MSIGRGPPRFRRSRRSWAFARNRMKDVVVRQNDASCDMNFGERASFSVHRVIAVESFLN